MEPFLIALLIISIILIPIFYILGKRRSLNIFLRSMLKVGYLFKVTNFKKQNPLVKKGGIVFVGDSITQDYNVYEYFSDLLVYNRGIGGDTTSGLLKRLDVSIFDLNPKTVVLLIGTNDFDLLKSTPNEVYERIKEIIQEIKEKLPKVKIILESVYPVNPTISKLTVGLRNNSDISELNNLLKEIKGVTFINLYDKLIKDNYLNPKYTTEGLHINEEGYYLITNTLKPYLMKTD